MLKKNTTWISWLKRCIWKLPKKYLQCYKQEANQHVAIENLKSGDFWFWNNPLHPPQPITPEFVGCLLHPSTPRKLEVVIIAIVHKKKNYKFKTREKPCSIIKIMISPVLFLKSTKTFFFNWDIALFTGVQEVSPWDSWITLNG